MGREITELYLPSSFSDGSCDGGSGADFAIKYGGLGKLPRPGNSAILRGEISKLVRLAELVMCARA